MQQLDTKSDRKAPRSTDIPENLFGNDPHCHNTAVRIPGARQMWIMSAFRKTYIVAQGRVCVVVMRVVVRRHEIGAVHGGGCDCGCCLTSRGMRVKEFYETILSCLRECCRRQQGRGSKRRGVLVLRRSRRLYPVLDQLTSGLSNCLRHQRATGSRADIHQPVCCSQTHAGRRQS
jgi:hypothetical protein